MSWEYREVSIDKVCRKLALEHLQSTCKSRKEAYAKVLKVADRIEDELFNDGADEVGELTTDEADALVSWLDLPEEV